MGRRRSLANIPFGGVRPGGGWRRPGCAGGGGMCVTVVRSTAVEPRERANTQDEVEHEKGTVSQSTNSQDFVADRVVAIEGELGNEGIHRQIEEDAGQQHDVIDSFVLVPLNDGVMVHSLRSKDRRCGGAMYLQQRKAQARCGK